MEINITHNKTIFKKITKIVFNLSFQILQFQIIANTEINNIIYSAFVQCSHSLFAGGQKE